MPLWVSFWTRSSALSSSGARVTSLRVEEVVATCPYTCSGEVEGWWKREALWAPFLDGWM